MVNCIKGFNADMTCRGFKFAPGKEYRHEGPVRVCLSGFHAVPDDLHPLTVLNFYPPAGSRYYRVECHGEIDRSDNKIASEIMRVCTNEISLRDLTLEAVKWVMDRSHPEGEIASGYHGAATASGYQGCAVSTGQHGMVRGDIDGIDLFARDIEWDGDKYVRKSIACGTTGENGIEAGVWYRCVAGRLVEADHG